MHNASVMYRENNQGLIDFEKWSALLPEKPARIIDVGCGNGKLCKKLSEMGHKVTGLDIVPGPYDRDGYDFVKHDLALGILPFEDDTFDLCLSFDVLEHLHQKWSYQVIWDMLRISREAILTIACEGGPPLHLTVKSPGWWLNRALQARLDANWRVLKVWKRNSKLPVILLHGKREEGETK